MRLGLQGPWVCPRLQLEPHKSPLKAFWPSQAKAIPPVICVEFRSVDTTCQWGFECSPPRPVALPRDRLWRFAALVIGTPTYPNFFEEPTFKPDKVINTSYSVKRIHQPWGFCTGDGLSCPARPPNPDSRLRVLIPSHLPTTSVPATVFIVAALLDLDAGLLYADLLWRLLPHLRSPLYF